MQAHLKLLENIFYIESLVVKNSPLENFGRSFTMLVQFSIVECELIRISASIFVVFNDPYDKSIANSFETFGEYLLYRESIYEK